MRFKYSDLLILSIGLYMCTNLMYRLLYIFISPNILAGMLVIISLVLIYINTLTKSDVYLCVFLISSSIYVILVGRELSINMEHIISFNVCCLILQKLRYERFRIQLCKSIERNKKILKKMIGISVLSVLIAMFNSRSYAYGFTGFSEGAHSFLSGLMIVFALYICIVKNEKVSLKELVIPIILAFSTCLGAARTYLLSLFVLILIYYFIKATKIEEKTIALIIAIIGVALIFNSYIIERFNIATNQSTLNGQDLLAAVTSGRTIFWKLDLQAFLSKPLFYKLFGSGYDFLYTYNLNHYGIKIWAHNDFIHLLNSIGIVGLTFYIVLLSRLICSIVVSHLKYNGRIRFSGILLFIYIICVAFFNGFYTYQQYIYSTLFLVCIFSLDRKMSVEV